MTKKNQTVQDEDKKIIDAEIVKDEPKPRRAKQAGETIEKNVTKIERYKERVPVAEADEEEEDAELDLDEELEIEEEVPLKSEVEILLEQAGSDELYTMRVDKLTDFSKDGRTDTQATKSFCMNISPPTLDYLDRIQRGFKGGAYLISMYKRGVGLVRRWIEHIAEPTEAPLPPPAPAQPFVIQPQPGSELDNFLSQLTKFGEIGKAFGWSRREQPTQPALPPAEPKDSFKETLDSLVKINELRAALGTEAAPAQSEGLLTTLVKEGFSLLKSPTGLQLIGTVQQILRQPRTNGAPQEQPAQANAPQQQMQAPQITNAQDAIGYTVAVLIQELAANKRVGHTADVIEEHCRRFPELKGMLLPLIGAKPSELLAQLSQMTGADLAALAHGEEWLADLQEEMQDFVEEVQAEMQAQPEQEGADESADLEDNGYRFDDAQAALDAQSSTEILSQKKE